MCCLCVATGDVSIHSTHDHMFTADYHYVGASFPQQTANRRALNGASLAVGKVCAEKVSTYTGKKREKKKALNSAPLAVGKVCGEKVYTYTEEKREKKKASNSAWLAVGKVCAEKVCVFANVVLMCC